ncbi:MAG: hypothetical protein WC650_03095 [Candidatus Doudnabacteria bacterium]
MFLFLNRQRLHTQSDIADSDNIESVAEVIWNIASVTRVTARDKAEKSFRLY